MTIRLRSHIVAGFVLLVTAATAAAAPTAHRLLPTSTVYATAAISLRHPPVKTTRCGPYTIVSGTWSGGATSPDERLAGTMIVTGRFRTDASGNGVGKGTLVVRDGRGRTRTKAAFRGVVTRRGPVSVSGLVTGRLFAPNKRLLANMTIGFDARYGYGGVRLGLDASANSGVAYTDCRKRR